MAPPSIRHRAAPQRPANKPHTSSTRRAANPRAANCIEVAVSLTVITNELKDLGRPGLVRYWLDFGVTYLLLLLGLGVESSAYARQSTGVTVIGLTVAVLAAYRAVAFMHEIAHVGARRLGSFVSVWHALVGIPLMVPLFLYRDVHLQHHRTRVYATADDAEYLSGAHRAWPCIQFVLTSLLLPFALWLRFAVLGPLSWLHPRLRQAVWRHGSRLAPRLGYPNAKPEDPGFTWSRLGEWCTSAYALGITAACVSGHVSLRVPLLWLLVNEGILLLSGLRAAASHRFLGDGQRMNRVAVCMDSVNVEGGLWSELWAPLGLRYHALHHLCPALPYHNLARAHRRLVRSLPKDSFYHLSTERSLWSTLHQRLMPHGLNRVCNSRALARSDARAASCANTQ